MRRLPLLSSLLPLLLWAAQQAGSARFERRTVEGVSTLAQYSGLRSTLQCAICCSRLPACVAWWQDPTADTCSLWKISEEGQTSLPQSNVYAIRLPPGYIMGPGNVAYRIIEQYRTWNNLMTGCKETDPRARPAVPTDDDSMTQLKDMTASGEHYHLGLRCTSETNYVDIEGHPVTVKGSWFNWGVVRSCTNSANRCAVVYTAGLYWSSCDNIRRFVCEIQNPVP